MAVTKILARRGGLAQAIAYVVNGDKTEEQVLTATQGCSIKSACAEMQDAKIRWNKTDGVQLYHIIQSFRPGEIEPELALEIAQEFVREHLPGYQAVIGIHTDREHIHAHTLLLVATAVPALAADDPLTVVNNLSDFIFSLIRAIGLILLGFGILQVGLSLKSHDPSQRANGMLTVAGGIVITFTKEILTLITG